MGGVAREEVCLSSTDAISPPPPDYFNPLLDKSTDPGATNAETRWDGLYNWGSLGVAHRQTEAGAVKTEASLGLLEGCTDF